MKNIAFAKIGKSIKFKTAYSPIGGDNEAPSVFKALVNHNPDKTFYLVGRSDYEKLNEYERCQMFPYNNIVNCYKDCGSVVDKPEYLIEWFKEHDITIDFGIMMIGQISTVTIPNKVEQIKDRSLIASVIDMTKNYSTPTINWLNQSDVPWIELINDPRYNKAQSRDFISEPIASLSQFDYKYNHSRIKSFEDQDKIDVEHNVTYSGIETVFCIDREYPDITSIEKDTSLTIVLNEGKPSRYNMLKEWILDYSDDVEIYGKWDCEEAEADKRFKGSIKLDQVQEKITRSKYTFIIPIRKGWVTSKYIEMIHAGCIPFFHPTYDEQYHLDVPDILRVRSPKQLYDAIDILESEPEVRIEVLKELQKVLKEEYYNGGFINELIMKKIDYDYIAPDLCLYNKKEYNTLF